MVRTKADSCPAGRKVVGAKAPRKCLGNSSASSSSGSSSSPGSTKSKYAGGNPVCPRPTPNWQQSITGFVTKMPRNGSSSKEGEESSEMASTSKSTPEDDQTKDTADSDSQSEKVSAARSDGGTNVNNEAKSMETSEEDEESE